MAKSLVNVSRQLGITTTATITEMDNPLGRAVGNTLEVNRNFILINFSFYVKNIIYLNYVFTLHQYHLQVIEALHCLKGMGPTDLEELVVTQGGLLLLTSQGMSLTLPVFITSCINYFI